MDAQAMRKIWDMLPVNVKCSDLRIPNEIRMIAANSLWSDVDFGRLIRCIALDTEVFATNHILPDLHMIQKKMHRREINRRRVEKYRKLNALNSCRNVEVEVDSITVTCSNEKEGDTDAVRTPDSTSCEKSPPTPIEKTPPIVPLKENGPRPLETVRGRGRKKCSRDTIGDDLFAAAIISAGAPSVGAYQETLRITAPEGPTGAVCGEEGKTIRQDIESDSRPNLERPVKDASPKGAGQKLDISWIPDKFALFWKRYPKKLGKGDALKSFTKLIKAQPDADKFMNTVLASLQWWCGQGSWTSDGGKYIPYPATWLNKGHWKDCEDNVGCATPGGAQFLNDGTESDEELMRRMMEGGNG